MSHFLDCLAHAYLGSTTINCKTNIPGKTNSRRHQEKHRAHARNEMITRTWKSRVHNCEGVLCHRPPPPKPPNLRKGRVIREYLQCIAYL